LIDLIKDAIAILDPEYKKKNLYLKMEESAEEIPKIEAEPNYLSQVFMNLIDNACKYTRTGGTAIKFAKSGDLSMCLWRILELA